MRRALPLVALLAVIGALPAAGAVQPTGFAFGRLGGSIRPYTVTIGNSGAVHATGAVMVSRTHVTVEQIVALNRVATETRFTVLPLKTNCRSSLPDVATTYVRVGAHTVRVHGDCMVRYQRMLRALIASVRVLS